LSRPDTDSGKLDHFGMSRGGNPGAIIPAMEDCLQAGI